MKKKLIYLFWAVLVVSAVLSGQDGEALNKWVGAVWTGTMAERPVSATHEQIYAAVDNKNFYQWNSSTGAWETTSVSGASWGTDDTIAVGDGRYSPIHEHPYWSSTNRPTTMADYGITDAWTSEAANAWGSTANQRWGSTSGSAWASTVQSWTSSNFSRTAHTHSWDSTSAGSWGSSAVKAWADALDAAWSSTVSSWTSSNFARSTHTHAWDTPNANAWGSTASQSWGSTSGSAWASTVQSWTSNNFSRTAHTHSWDSVNAGAWGSTAVQSWASTLNAALWGSAARLRSDLDALGTWATPQIGAVWGSMATKLNIPAACGSTDKFSWVSTNGTLQCSADQTGGGGGWDSAASQSWSSNNVAGPIWGSMTTKLAVPASCTSTNKFSWVSANGTLQCSVDDTGTGTLPAVTGHEGQYLAVTGGASTWETINYTDIMNTPDLSVYAAWNSLTSQGWKTSGNPWGTAVAAIGFTGGADAGHCNGCHGIRIMRATWNDAVWVSNRTTPEAYDWHTISDTHLNVAGTRITYSAGARGSANNDGIGSLFSIRVVWSTMGQSWTTLNAEPGNTWFSFSSPPWASASMPNSRPFNIETNCVMYSPNSGHSTFANAKCTLTYTWSTGGGGNTIVTTQWTTLLISPAAGGRVYSILQWSTGNTSLRQKPSELGMGRY